jgi:transcriptional regulator with XRE-family HTH domain
MLRLKLWRLQGGLTQAAAAAQIGIGESTLALLESGRMRPTEAQLDRLRTVFGSAAESVFEEVRERVGVTPQ